MKPDFDSQVSTSYSLPQNSSWHRCPYPFSQFCLPLGEVFMKTEINFFSVYIILYCLAIVIQQIFVPWWIKIKICSIFNIYNIYCIKGATVK